MTEQEIVKEILKERKLSQRELADKMGLKWATNVTNRLNRNTMNVTSLCEMLDAMGYELIIRDTMNDRKEYKVR